MMSSGMFHPNDVNESSLTRESGLNRATETANKRALYLGRPRDLISDFLPRNSKEEGMGFPLL